MVSKVVSVSLVPYGALSRSKFRQVNSSLCFIFLVTILPPIRSLPYLEFIKILNLSSNKFSKSIDSSHWFATLSDSPGEVNLSLCFICPVTTLPPTQILEFIKILNLSRNKFTKYNVHRLVTLTDSPGKRIRLTLTLTFAWFADYWFPNERGAWELVWFFHAALPLCVCYGGTRRTRKRDFC